MKRLQAICGPFTQSEMERVCGGPFWCCPMTVVYTAADPTASPPKPEKFRPCTNASKKKKGGISVNDQIDSDEFPTRWGSAAQMGEYVSRFTSRQIAHVDGHRLVMPRVASRILAGSTYAG
jgi:hypothetical protein